MKGKCIIAIPSRGRSRFLAKKNYIFGMIPPGYQDCPIVVFVREQEGERYRRAKDASGLPVLIETVPNECGIADKRQLILDRASEQGIEKVLMMDDDLRITPWNPTFSSKYAKGGIPSAVVFKDCVEQLFAMCDKDHPMNGLLFTMGSSGNKVMFSSTKKFFDCYSIHVPTLEEQEIRFTGLMEAHPSAGPLFMEDFFVQSALRLAGYPVLTNHLFICGNTARLDGGCESAGQRNPSTQENTARAMLAEFPEFISLTEHPADTYCDYDRVDVKIDNKWAVENYGGGIPIDKDAIMRRMRDNGYQGKFLVYKGH